MVKLSETHILGVRTNYFFTLLALYTIAHGGLAFILNAVYWDDWVLYHVPARTVLETFRMAGTFLNWVGYLHVGMQSLGPWAYHALTFVLYFLSGIYLWRVLERHAWIEEQTRLTIVALFLVLPFNIARVAAINFPYAVCYLFFFVGWSALGRFRFLALLSFFIAFNTQSLLVFYALPAFEYFVRTAKPLSLRATVDWSKRNVDILLLPFAFWILKKAFFKPYGMYAGYNEHLSFHTIVPSLVAMPSYIVSQRIPMVMLMLCGVPVGLLLRALPAQRKRHLFFAFGFVALATAIFPYLILGLVPTFTDWTSRHQILMPLGVSLLIAGLGTIIRPPGGGSITQLVISASLAWNISAYYGLYIDEQKQQDLIEFFRSSPQVRNASLVVFDDNAENAIDRKYRFYEWTGLLKKAFGDETRFAVGLSDLAAYRDGGFDMYFKDYYNAKSHRRTKNPSQVTVTIKIGADADQPFIGRRKYDIEAH
jgi:hypothetical protein